MSDMDDDRGDGKPPKPPKDRKKNSPHYRQNNKGGFGNPPVRSQFKPGGKGGPGRNKGVTSLESAMREMFKSKAIPKDANGNPMEAVLMPKAIAQRVKGLILTGPLKALEMGIRLSEKYGPKDNAAEFEKLNLESFSLEELTILEGLWNRMLVNTSADDGNMADPALRFIEGHYRVYIRDDGHVGITKISESVPEAD